MVEQVVVLGIDGGGTRTRALLTDPAGSILGRGEAGPANPADVGPELACASIRAAVDAAWRERARPRTPLAAACIGLGGLRSAFDCGRLGLEAESLGLVEGAPLLLMNDLQVAHYAAHRRDPGVTLVAGTGSACFGRGATGRTWWAGGWGSRLDDGGSGYDLGRRLLRAAIRALDGRAPELELTRSVVGLLEVDDLALVPALVECGEIDRRRIASLAPLVVAAARDGDEVARELVRGGADELAALVRAVVVGTADGVTAPADSVATVGGAFDREGFYRQELAAALDRIGTSLEVVPARRAPVEGAALLAVESLNPDRSAVPRMMTALPEENAFSAMPDMSA